MYVVGLTGGIGSGKSTVANIFNAQFHIDVIDADQLARDVVAPNSPALQQIRERFSSDIIFADGNLNRTRLRELVFANSAEKIWLEQLLHPLIRQEALEQIKAASSTYCIYMAPLLIEKQLFSMVDRILVIDIKPELQLARTLVRDKQSQEQVQAIMTSQVSREQRLKHADDVIDNSGERSNLEAQVKTLHEKYCALAKIKASEK